LVLYLAWQIWQRVVRRPWTIRLGDTRRLRLYPHSVVAAFVLYYRVYDYEDLSFVRAFLRPGDIFVDVGANVGVYSLWASETDGVDVVAFEPSGLAHARAAENVDLNGLSNRVRLLRKAVGGEPGIVRLTTGQDALNRVAGHGVAPTEAVEQTTLDAELGSVVPAVVKIDVEGGELDVLRGARQSILRHRPALIIEVNEPQQLEALLAELGYQTWSYDPKLHRLLPTAPQRGSNVLALADVDAARARLGTPGAAPEGRPTVSPNRGTAGVRSFLIQRLPIVRLALLLRDFLRPSGWLESSRQNVPVNRDGEPLPWYTYPAISFLEPRLQSDMAVFEYGAGNSTLWWAERVAHVSAVESDPVWIALLGPRLPKNADVQFERADGIGYPRAALERGRRFDIVVIDGEGRSACAFACLPALKEDGIVIWDNADWSDRWADGMAHLTANGFRRIDFHGLGPLVWRPWTTSVFYRPVNCLGI